MQRALAASLVIFLGAFAAPISLAFGTADGCAMPCCLEHGEGEGVECCAFRHAGANGKAALQAKPASKCPANCGAAPSSSQLFPKGLNRPAGLPLEVESISASQYYSGDDHHKSFRFTPKSPRAPPAI